MQITYEDFKKVQIKVGTVLEVKKNEKARKPSLVVKVDFGKEINDKLIKTGYAREIKKVTKERKRTIKKK